MEWWWLLLADGCPDAGKPLPDCLEGWTGEHDMAEAGELAHASMVRAGMRLWSTSADVSEEGPKKEPAMPQTPAVVRPSLSSADGVHSCPRVGPLLAAWLCLRQCDDVGGVGAKGCSKALPLRGCRSLCSGRPCVRRR